MNPSKTWKGKLEGSSFFAIKIHVQAVWNQCRPRYISQCLELSPTGALIYHQFRLCTLLCKVIYLINYCVTMAITFCFKKVRFGDALNYLLILKEHFTRFHERYLSQGKSKMIQISQVSRNQLHDTANSCQLLSFGWSWPGYGQCVKAKHCQ